MGASAGKCYVCCVGKAVDEYDPLRKADPFLLAASPALPSIPEKRRARFQLLPEQIAIDVADEFVAPFSLPSEALVFVPDASTVVRVFPNGDGERKIHCNIQLTAAEQEQLLILEIAARGESFCPFIAVAATRYLDDTQGDASKALKAMKSTQTWRTDTFLHGPISGDSVLDDLAHGAIYICGRDSAMRPTIVFRPNRMPLAWHNDNSFDTLLRVTLFCMEYVLRYMCVPGRVETNCLIFDLAGVSLKSLPRKALTELYNAFSRHFPGRAHAFYICNLSPTAGMAISGLIRATLSQRQRHKLMVIKKNSELLQFYAQHQLEVDLGGTRPVVEKFFPFPLEPGPFTAGSHSGPNALATPNLHKAFSPGGLQGQLWDPGASREKNLQLGYSEDALELFERCGLSNLQLEPPAYIQQANRGPVDHGFRRPPSQVSCFNGLACLPQSPRGLSCLPRSPR